MTKILLINYPFYSKYYRLKLFEHYFKEKGIETDTKVNTIWGNTLTKIEMVRNPFKFFKISFKEFKYVRKLIKIVKEKKYDFLIIGYPAYFEFFSLYLFKKNYRKRIYIDFFLSLYDTIVLDRKLLRKNNLFARCIFCIDKLLLKLAPVIIVDTSINAERYSRIFNIPYNKFFVIWVGTNLIIKDSFLLNKKYSLLNKEEFNIGWVGSFIPLHGIDKILKTAQLLKDKNVVFHIIGSNYKDNLTVYKDTAEKNNLRNIIFYGEKNYFESMSILNECNVCLGIFGDSNKSKSVIPYKIFDYLYLNKTIITQTALIEEELQEFKNISFTKPNPESIAQQILYIRHNPVSFDSRTLLLSKLENNYNKFLQKYGKT